MNKGIPQPKRNGRVLQATGLVHSLVSGPRYVSQGRWYPLVLEAADLTVPGVALVQSPNQLTFLVVRIPWLLSGWVVTVKWSPLSPSTMR